MSERSTPKRWVGCGLLMVLGAVLVVLPNGVGAASYYVSLSGNDANPGTLQQPFRTVQKGIQVIQPGDTLFLRGGRYAEYVTIPHNKQGTPENWFHVRSYPGEWAILDPGHAQERPVIQYTDSGHTRCPMYWKFTNFEVTGGGRVNGPNQAGGGGFAFRTAAHIVFEYLYIHNNRGGGATNDGGICIQNSDYYGPQNITIRFCHLKDNCDPTNGNNGNIVLFADYWSGPLSSLDIAKARQRNEVSYNLSVGSCIAFRSKSMQYLSLDHTGQHMAYADRGDRFHHNIVRDFKCAGIQVKADFPQIYQNIIEGTGARTGIIVGTYNGNSHREPFHAVVFNNTLIRTEMNIQRVSNAYPLPVRPHVHFYNNIIHNVGSQYDGRNDLNLMFTWNEFTAANLDMDTFHVEGNYLHPRTTSERVINLGPYNNDLSTAEYLSRGYSRRFYATTTPGLFRGADGAERFLVNPAHAVASGRTVADGGHAGAHPYLADLTIPAFIGAVDPASETWVAGVLGLADVANLIHGEGVPAWVAGTVPPPTPGNLRLIDR